jgi:sugar lactone lactonase YvrE
MVPTRLAIAPAFALFALSLAACPAPAGDDDDGGPIAGCDGIALLGCGAHTEDSVVIELVADGADGIDTPRDLAFHPDHPGQLWIVQKDQSLVLLDEVGTADQEATVLAQAGVGTEHFYAVPSGIAFSADTGNWASSHETDQLTQGPPPFGTPEDFMGPTLWTGDPSLYEGAPAHGQHLDMLHNSPNGMGIAWEEENTFWYFDGYHSSITRYAFNSDHGLGGADHSDGETARYVEGDVSRRPGVPSGLEFVHETDELYIADTGNDRIAVLDCASGTEGAATEPNYDGGAQYRMDNAAIRTLALGGDTGFDNPSGIAVQGDFVYVTDNRNGNLIALSRADGSLVDWLELDVPRDSLMGIAFDADGDLYVVNHEEDQILRIRPAAQ